jgi:serine protease
MIAFARCGSPRMVRAALLLCALFWGALATAAVQAALPRMAMGVIVKLKDSQQVSVVRVQPSRASSESVQTSRRRLDAMAIRQRVAFSVHKRTAFAAELIHMGHPTTWQEAHAEALRLRADTDVEWAIVNELLQPAATASAVVIDDPGYFGQTWLQARVSGVNDGVANFPAAWSAIDDWVAGTPSTQAHALSPVVVAVLDTGILPGPLGGVPTLPPLDLVDRLWAGYDFVSASNVPGDGDGMDSDPADPGFPPGVSLPSNCGVTRAQWHGLTIGYMLGASGGNGLDGAGILSPLPGPVLLPVRVGGLCGAGVSDIIEGMLWAAGIDYAGAPARNPHPARIINLSYAGPESCEDAGPGVFNAAWLYRQTIALLTQQGVLVVAAAGNGDETAGSASTSQPANCAGVLAVTGLNARGFKARYANLVDGTAAGHFGLAVASGDGRTQTDASSDPSVQADQGILTLIDKSTGLPSGQYEMRAVAGTSYAAPTAAGVAALMLAIDPSLTVSDLLAGLTGSGRVFDFPNVPSLAVCRPDSSGKVGTCNCDTQSCGSGILDAERAVLWAIDQAQSHPNAPPFVGQVVKADFISGKSTANASTAPTAAGGGGGGGAVDDLGLFALATIASLTCGVALRRQVKSGRP